MSCTAVLTENIPKELLVSLQEFCLWKHGRHCHIRPVNRPLACSTIDSKIYRQSQILVRYRMQDRRRESFFASNNSCLPICLSSPPPLFLFSAMAVPPPRTCSGSWTPSSRSSGTYIGPIRNSPRISTRDWNSWLVIWSSPAFNGRLCWQRRLPKERHPLVVIYFRTVLAFQKNIQQGILLNPTAYVLPTEICAMVNVVLDAKNQSFKLCSVDGVDVVSKSRLVAS